MNDPLEQTNIVRYSPEFIEKINQFQESIYEKHKKMSGINTPKDRIKKRPDNYEYVDESYLRDRLNKYFPIWNWCCAGNSPVEVSIAEWVLVSGILKVFDNGIWREFFSPGAARIQFKSGLPRIPENIVDLDKVVASANTNAFKRAINRLCNIADDIYRKEMQQGISNSKKEEWANFYNLKLTENLKKEVDNYINLRGGLDNFSDFDINNIIKNMSARMENL